MEITDVQVIKLEVDLNDPAGVSRNRELDSRAAALIVIETDSGITGIGEGVGPEPYIVEIIVEEKYRPRLIGEDPLDIELLWSKLLTEDLYWERKGQGVSAASGIDIALWDIAGKHRGEPVHRLLGGRTDDRVQAYASDLFWDDPETMANRAASYVKEGFPAVKTHLGRGLNADEERVCALREAIDDAELMVDMNCGYDYPDALRVGQMLADYDVYWYEEPLSPYDVDGLTDLRRELDVPLATGENEYTKWGFRELCEERAVDYVMPDVMRCGGITELKKITSLAETFNMVCSPHSFSTGVGLAATLQTMATSSACEWLELDVTGYDLYESVLASPLDIDDHGRVAIPTDPGIGAVLPDDIRAEYKI